MNDGPVLNIRPRADPDKIDVTADDRAEPDARILADLDIADDDRVMGDESAFMDTRFCRVERSKHIKELCELNTNLDFGR
jgi:hypothetical protein